jgi:coproporphyrinogen III oxidase
MNRTFPVIESHSKAWCFNCGGDLTGDYWCDSGNAPGHGQFRQDCEKCQMSTWYDLVSTTNRYAQLKARL